MPSVSAKMKILSVLFKNYWKIDIEFFPYGSISHENQSLSQIFFEWLYVQNLYLQQQSHNFKFFCNIHFLSA